MHVCTWESWDSLAAPLKVSTIKKSKYGPIFKVYGTDGFEKLTSKEKNRLEELPVHHGLTTHVPLTTLDIDLAAKDLLVAEVILMRTHKREIIQSCMLIYIYFFFFPIFNLYYIIHSFTIA